MKISATHSASEGPAKASSGSVQSLARGMAILEMVAKAPDGLSLQEIADALGVATATAFNLTATLLEANAGAGSPSAGAWLEKTPRPVRYKLGPRLRQLAEIHRSTGGAGSGPTHAQCRAAMQALRTALPGANALLCQAVGAELIALMRIEGPMQDVIQEPRSPVRVPYSTATSLCYLAFADNDDRIDFQTRYSFSLYGAGLWGSEENLDRFLIEARQRGYACPETLGAPLRAAAPIYNRDGTLWGCIGASTTSKGMALPDAPSATPAATRARIIEACLRVAAELTDRR